MAKKDRQGRRKKRARYPTRDPDLGYYILVTNAENTEKYYFEGFRDSLPKDVQGKLVIKVMAKVGRKDIIEQCEEAVAQHPQFAIPWLIIDRDEEEAFDELIIKAERKGINVGWSNPCIETWLHCYFKTPTITDNSTQCITNFKKTFCDITNITYKKSDRGIYRHLFRHGDERKAIERAERRYLLSKKNSKNKQVTAYFGCTRVHKLVAEIRSKTNP